MRINFDANASARPLPEVIDALRVLDGSALNPSAVHGLGRKAKALLDDARNSIAELLGTDKLAQIIFTSGATEANNIALASTKGTALLCGAIEHAAVLEPLRSLANAGATLTELSLNTLRVPNSLDGFVNTQTDVFACMLVNNETGEELPVQGLSQVVRRLSAKARIHCDAVAALGKMPVHFDSLNVDTLAISGHKIGALSGVGALVAKEKAVLRPLTRGGPQEFGIRAGTENVVGIVSLGIAAKVAKTRLATRVETLVSAKKHITEMLLNSGTPVAINAVPNQISNTLSIRVPGLKADDVVVAADLAGLSISSGSACGSGRPSPSHVLLAYGFSEFQARECIRISFEPDVEIAEVIRGSEILVMTLQRMYQAQRRAA